MLKQALSRARALVMAQAGPGLGLLGAAQHAGGAWEAAARTLSSLPSLRSFHHQSQAQQGAAAEAPGAPAEAQPRSQPLPPWTPTRDLQKRKVLTKRMAHLMQVLEHEREAEAQAAKKLPDFRAGDVLELKLSVPENKRRVTTFKGVVIARSNRGYRSTFTLRNMIGTSGGIERTFPLYSPHILEMRVTDSLPARRAKLYYLRDRKMNRI